MSSCGWVDGADGRDGGAHAQPTLRGKLEDGKEEEEAGKNMVRFQVANVLYQPFLLLVQGYKGPFTSSD